MMNLKNRSFLVFCFSLFFLNNNFLHAARKVTTQDLVNGYLDKGLHKKQIETIIGNIDFAVKTFTAKSKMLSISQIVRICRLGLPGISDLETTILIQMIPSNFPHKYLNSDKKHQYRNKLIPINKALQFIYDIILQFLPAIKCFAGSIYECSGLKTESKIIMREAKMPAVSSGDNEYEEVIFQTKKEEESVFQNFLATEEHSDFSRFGTYKFDRGYDSAPELLEGRVFISEDEEDEKGTLDFSDYEDGYYSESGEEYLDDADIADIKYMLKQFGL